MMTAFWILGLAGAAVAVGIATSRPRERRLRKLAATTQTDPISVSLTSKAKVRILVIRHGDRVSKPGDIPKQPTEAEWLEAVAQCRQNLKIIQKEIKEKKRKIAKRIRELDQFNDPEYKPEGVARLDEKDKDALSPLKREEEARIKALKATLAGAGASFDLVRTSSHIHAMQTADLLANSKQSISANDALTPGMPDRLFKIDTIVKTDIKPGQTLTLVGHENRLSQIIVLLTGKRLRPLNQLDVVCVEADSRADLLLGCAEVVWRLPVVAYEEETLRPKVNSKMTAATFLAGFTATAWIQVVMNARMPPIPWPQLIPAEAVASNEALVQLVLQWCAVAAMLCLSAALACFVSAVFIYDRLNMPVGSGRRRGRRPIRAFRNWYGTTRTGTA
jgi:phosphohistidine phosphatase SixA